jgi:acyl-coenzyme A thioesterase PaaI-like protein
MTDTTTMPGHAGGNADDDFARMTEALRGFNDQLPGARPGPELLREMQATLTRWTAELGTVQVPEGQREYGCRADLPSRGQTMSPWTVIDHLDGDGLRATVRFGRHFVGHNGAVHGGAVALVFDELLGQASHAARPLIARTAYLHVNYRSITPADRDLQVTARLVSLDGRKRVVAGEIRDGARLCCDAEGLWVELKPGQP